jgi:DNA-binding response OmpR family regulator
VVSAGRDARRYDYGAEKNEPDGSRGGVSVSGTMGAMKLLLIDSDPVARDQLEQAALAEPGCVVLSVDDFAQGWAALMEAEEPFDAVLADPGPVDGPGFEWLRQMRTGSWARPVSVVLCFVRNPATMDRALAIGAGHFVFKPYLQPAIAAKLAQLARARAYFNFASVGVHG